MESVYKNRYVNNKTKTFSISVIISIYNLERYLEEAILSVINQTIGFKNNVQLILVNDGSMDRSESICLKYADKYPDNIVYIKKNNGGVSSSRNIGIENASGELICFLDGDDKFESHAFEHVWKFYLQNKNEVDVISCRTRFFEAREDFHVLDFKFDKGLE